MSERKYPGAGGGGPVRPEDLLPEPEFVISRVFAAPRERVFDAWTEPERIARWWGPHGFSMPVCRMDLRPGGAYRLVMRSPEGTDYPLKGVYRQVEEPSLLVMTEDTSEHPPEWHDLVDPHRPRGQGNPAWEAVSTVTFEEVRGGTRVTVRTRFESVEVRDAFLRIGMREGWSQSLDRLAEHLERSAAFDAPPPA